jgi:hypothetical protein
MHLSRHLIILFLDDKNDLNKNRLKNLFFSNQIKAFIPIQVLAALRLYLKI